MNRSRRPVKARSSQLGFSAIAADWRPKRLVKCLAVFAGVMLSTGCASFDTRSALPSCANVRGYYNPDIPIGAERLGSRLWLERRIVYADSVGSVIRRVAARHANGDWQAGRMRIPLLAENGFWKTTVYSGLAGLLAYDVNFDARAWPEPDLATARLERRSVQVYLQVFGPGLGAWGLERSLRLIALKYRGASDADWALCPVRR
jgi:hypothetical protein